VRSPSLDQLLRHADSNYAAVIISSKRARQLNAYRRRNLFLEDEVFETIAPPMVPPSGSDLTTALEELASGHLSYRYRSGPEE
jgi:DNA-directed RNA polymerase omega subunit